MTSPKPETPTTFGAALKKLRESRGLTQAALAYAADLAASTIFAAEQGRLRDPKWSTVQRLADALGCRTDELRG
jgi:transcriptional regulator with XRE-family HTH domain